MSKKFAIYHQPNEAPIFAEGESYDIKKKSDSLKITINSTGKKKQVFEKVVMFCQVIEKIKPVTE